MKYEPINHFICGYKKGIEKEIFKDKAPRIALVGCGAIAETFYLPAITRIPLVARKLILVDINLERAKAVATKFGITSYIKDYKSIVADIDGVIIALPHHLHFKVSLDFLRAGVHVLCEKPLAETFEQAKSMIQEAERNKVTLCVNYTRRLFPSFRKVKELLSDRTIGQPISFYLEEGGEFHWPTVSGFYFNSKTSKHGVLMDRGPHVIDLVCWWFNSKPKVITFIDDSFGGCEAVAALNFLINGCIPGSIKLSWLSKLKNKCIIQGREGTLICEVHNWREITLIKNDKHFTIRLTAPQRYFSDFGHEIVNNFIAVIQRQQRPSISAQDVLGSISVIEECYKHRKRFSMPWMEVDSSAASR